MENFQRTVAEGELGDVSVPELRRYIPDNFRIYSFRHNVWWPRKLVLDWDRPVGSSLVIYDWAEGSQGECSEITPLLIKFNTFEVVAPNIIASDLTGAEHRLFNSLGSQYPYPAGAEKLIDSVWGHEHEFGNRKKDLWVVISRLRAKMLEKTNDDFVVYGVGSQSEYLISPRLDEGTWLITPDKMEFIDQMEDEIKDFMIYCNEVRVNGDTRLEFRLSPSQLRIINCLGNAYPDRLSREEIFELVWGRKSDLDDDKNFWVVISRIRGVISEYQQGRFGVSCDGEGKYGIE